MKLKFLVALIFFNRNQFPNTFVNAKKRVNLTALLYSYVICMYVTVCNFIFITVDWHVNMCCNVYNISAALVFRIVL